MSKTIKTVSNSATAVDFNKEVASFMSNTDHAAGRELRLAVAIYNNPADFNIATLLGGNGNKSRSAGMKAALRTRSAAFNAQCDKADAAKKKANAKSQAGFIAKADAEAANRVVSAAVTMFERALIDAYFMRAGECVVVKVTDKAVTLHMGKAVTIGDATYDAGIRDVFTRKSVYENGRKLCVARGILSAPKSAKSGSGATLSTGAEDTMSKSAALLADTVAKLPAADRASVTTRPEFEKMLAQSVRARFAADGVIDVADLLDMLRKSDAMQGVTFNIDGVKPERKPRKAA